MNVDNGELRNLNAPQADPILGPREVALAEAKAQEIMKLRKTVPCKECGTEMAAGGNATTGTCGRCMDRHYVKEIMQLGLTEPMSRAERRRVMRGVKKGKKR